MFLCRKVVVGKGKRVFQVVQDLTTTPSGFHSVLGETGQELNYDEIVVYDDAAPRYLIVYAT